MKQGKNAAFPVLRRQYDDLRQLGAIINRGRVTVCQRLSGASPWKATEKELILEDLIKRGIETEKSPATFSKYFGG